MNTPSTFEEVAVDILDYLKHEFSFLEEGQVNDPIVLRPPITFMQGAGPIDYIIPELDMPGFIGPGGYMERWHQAVEKLEGMGAFKIQNDSKRQYEYIVLPNHSKIEELYKKFEHLVPVSRCGITLNRNRKVLQYGNGPEVYVDVSTEQMRLLAMLLENGEVTYAEIKAKIASQKGNRDIQALKRDLLDGLIAKGFPKKIKEMIRGKRGSGFVLTCGP